MTLTEEQGGFDLEKARAADEVLPYPLDAKEIWVSGKGQMHINPPNAPSIFFTLSDLCEFRNIFHGQAAEIERLRAMIDSSDHIVEPDELIGFDLERARGLRDFLQDDCAEVGDVWAEMIAEIERLRAEMDNYGDDFVCQMKSKDARIKELESSLDEAEALTKKNADLMNAYLARIAELEDALVEGLTNFLHYRASCYDPARRCPYAKECDDCSTWDACGHVEMFRSEARQRLQADGKIGPDDSKKISHLRPYEVVAADLAGMLAQSWQITEERKAALNSILEYISYDSHDDIEICGHADILRAMLEGAE